MAECSVWQVAGGFNSGIATLMSRIALRFSLRFFCWIFKKEMDADWQTVANSAQYVFRCLVCIQATPFKAVQAWNDAHWCPLIIDLIGSDARWCPGAERLRTRVSDPFGNLITCPRPHGQLRPLPGTVRFNASSRSFPGKKGEVEAEADEVLLGCREKIGDLLLPGTGDSGGTARIWQWLSAVWSWP